MQNRTDILRQLTEVNQALEREAIIIEDQKQAIISLCVSGGDATEATQLLASMEQAQAFRLEEFDRLLDALDKLPPFEEGIQS